MLLIFASEKERLINRNFAIAGGMALLIAFSTISLQAVKAAMVNPVKTPRDQ